MSEPPSVINPFKFERGASGFSQRDNESVRAEGVLSDKEQQDNFQKFVVNQQSQFYNQKSSAAGPPIQQTYQMFMPNKIKKGKDFKKSHDILKRTNNNNHLYS